MTKDMTAGSPTKLILAFAIPLLIGNIFQQFYNMADAVVVGQFVGVKALAAVGATGSINFLILGFVMGMTSGFSVLVAQSFGAGDESKMRHCIAMSVYLCMAFTVIITAFSMFMIRPLLILMKTPEDIFSDAYAYISIICTGAITAIFYNMFAAILRALGDSKTPLYFLVLASLLNVALDLIFVISFSMGVAGAAYATVISQGTSAILCLIYMLKKYKVLKFNKEELKFSKVTAIALLKIGTPMALQFSITAVGVMILQSAINSFGSNIVAGYTAAAKVEQLATQPMVTFGVTMATYTGQNLGAGKLERIRTGVNRCIIISSLFCIANGILIILFGSHLVNLFISGDEPEVLAAATQYLNTVGIFFIPLGLLFIYRNVLQGLGDGFIPMLAGFFELVSRVIVAFGFSGYIGYAAICLASPVAWIAAAALLMIAYYKKIKIFKIPEQFTAKNEVTIGEI